MKQREHVGNVPQLNDKNLLEIYSFNIQLISDCTKRIRSRFQFQKNEASLLHFKFDVRWLCRLLVIDDINAHSGILNV